MLTFSGLGVGEGVVRICFSYLWGGIVCMVCKAKGFKDEKLTLKFGGAVYHSKLQLIVSVIIVTYGC